MLVPIACRFIPYDQWFVTHLDDKWKVRQVKHWILSRCSLLSSSPKTHRSVSPITFAPSARSQSSIDSLDDGYNEDDEYSDQDVPHRSPPFKPRAYSHLDVKPRSSSQTAQPASNPLVDRYTLMSFSTGSILEDEFTLSWYNLRPYELLEVHPAGTVAPLQRDVLAEYIQPYFLAKVRVLRIVWNHRSGRFEAPGIDIQYEHHGFMTKDQLAHTLDSFSPKSSSFQSDKRRKTKVNWKARWVVINQGILSLCKEHVTNPPIHQFALSTMTALRGTDALERAFSIVTQPRVVCIKFRPRSASLTSVVSPPPSLPSSPFPEDSRGNTHEPLSRVGSVFDSKTTVDQEDVRERSDEYADDPNDSYKGEGEWVILDMLDDHAFSSILRILHREAFQPISSSFAPSSSIMAVSPHSPVVASFDSYDTIPYPEWRIHTVENARKAGMGDVGKPMAWVLWTDKGLGESLLGNIRHHRQAFLQEMQYKTTTIPFDIYGPGDDSDDDSEMEWEGWMRDLERQSQVKQRSEKVSRCAASRQAQIPSSQLPSPPLSEASHSGSPRARSPSLSGSTGSTPHGQYPNIGNVIEAHGYGRTEFSYSPEWMKSTIVSTVSVGMAPSSRRRSSTISTGAATPTRHDKGKQVRERLSSISVSSARARTVCAAVGVPCSPSTPDRHAPSSANLRMASSANESDAAESPMHPTPSSPPKRQGAFMRGMTLRAGKLVRGLESAIDFVDEKM